MNVPRLIALPLVLATLLGVTLVFDSYKTPSTTQMAAAIVPSVTLPPPEITAESAVIYDIRSGTLLYAKNESAQLPLASITKLMTAVVARESISENEAVSIDARALERDGDSGLLPNQLWGARELLDMTLVESSNDGAQALAYAVEPFIRSTYPNAPYENAFVWRMNELARTIGLTQTYYLDPTGLDVSETMASAYGSALDVALLLSYITRAYPTLLGATAEHTLVVSDYAGAAYTLNNTDKATDIPGLIAGKTGYTDLAGGNLAIVFDADIGRPVVVVALHSTKEGRFEDVRALTTYAHTLIENAPLSGTVY